MIAKKYPRFREIFPDSDTFNDWMAVFEVTIPDPDVFSHLSIRFGGDRFAYSSISVAVSKMAQILAVEYPAYKQRKETAELIYALDLEEFKKGMISINNTAENPNTDPATDALDPLPFINAQVVAGVKLSEFEALQRKYRAVYTNYLNQFLDKFDDLFFKIIPESEDVLLYD